MASDAAANNGMHPTPHQRASHGAYVGARVMPSVSCLPDAKRKKRTCVW